MYIEHQIITEQEVMHQQLREEIMRSLDMFGSYFLKLFYVLKNKENKKNKKNWFDSLFFFVMKKHKIQKTRTVFKKTSK